MAVLPEKDHIEGLTFGLGPHARRAVGHSRHRQTNGNWTLGEKTTDVRSGNMAFDRVVTDDCGVARHKVIGNATHALERREFFHASFFEADAEAGLAQMPDPVVAAGASGVLDDVDAFIGFIAELLSPGI